MEEEKKDIWKKLSLEDIEKTFGIGESIEREEKGSCFKDKETEIMFCKMWAKYRLDKYLEEFPRN